MTITHYESTQIIEMLYTNLPTSVDQKLLFIFLRIFDTSMRCLLFNQTLKIHLLFVFPHLQLELLFKHCPSCTKIKYLYDVN